MSFLDGLLGAGQNMFGGLVKGDGNILDSMIGPAVRDPKMLLGVLPHLLLNDDDQAPAPAQTQAPAQEMVNPDLEVTGDGWKPRKPTILGAIADAFLMSRGGKPMFSIMRDQRNVNEALSDFGADPMTAIRRLSRVPGQEGKAWDMYNQTVDNQRADVQADSLNDSRSEKYMTRVGGMLNAIMRAKDPAAAYSANIDRIRKYAEGRGLDISALPDAFDEDAINSYIMGGVSPDDQLKMEALEQYRSQRLGQIDRSLDQRDTTQQNTQAYRERRLDQIDTAEEGKNNRSKVVQGQQAPRYVRDPQGNVVGRIDKSGKVAELKAPDGGTQYFEVLPDGKLGRRIPNELIKVKGK